MDTMALMAQKSRFTAKKSHTYPKIYTKRSCRMETSSNSLTRHTLTFLSLYVFFLSVHCTYQAGRERALRCGSKSKSEINTNDVQKNPCRFIRNFKRNIDNNVNVINWMFNAKAQTHLVALVYEKATTTITTITLFYCNTYRALANPDLFLLCVIKRKKARWNRISIKKTINGFFQQKKRNLDKNGSTKPNAKVNISYAIVYLNSRISSACVFECMSFQYCTNAK